MTTPQDPGRPAEPPPLDASDAADGETPEEPPTPRPGRFPSVPVDRYLPVIAIIAMTLTFVEIQNAFVGLTLIAAVWLIATRVSKSRRFLGLTLTEGLAWDATVLIFVGIFFSLFAVTQTPA